MLDAYKDAVGRLKRVRERMDKAVAQNRPDAVTEATREVEELARVTDRLQRELRDLSALLTSELDRFDASLQADMTAVVAQFSEASRAIGADLDALWAGTAAPAAD